MREAKYYFGRTATDDYLAYKLGHLFIHGVTQFYLDAYVDSFLLRFIEEITPNETVIYIHDCSATETIWDDRLIENVGWKGIAAIGRVFYSNENNTLLDSLTYMRNLYEKRINSGNLSKEKSLIFLIRDYGRCYNDEVREQLKFFIENGACAKMFLILTSSGDNIAMDKELIQSFDYVVSTTNSEENSYLLFDTDDASNNILPAFGFIIIKSGEDILRFHSLFYPYTFIKKVIRSLSMNKDEKYAEVTKDDSTD